MERTPYKRTQPGSGSLTVTITTRGGDVMPLTHATVAHTEFGMIVEGWPSWRSNPKKRRTYMVSNPDPRGDRHLEDRSSLYAGWVDRIASVEVSTPAATAPGSATVN